MNILVLDNYDSFTYNLVHLLRALNTTPTVIKNNQINMSEINQYDKILLSPGPGIPDEAGQMKDVIRTFGATKSILGICLGHQGIAEVFGATLYNLPNVLHGVTSTIETRGDDYLFQNIPTHFLATHYHSWAIRADSIPNHVEVTATNPDGLVMAIRHQQYDVRGLQFHPESIMTTEGPQIIKNWIQYKM